MLTVEVFHLSLISRDDSLLLGIKSTLARSGITVVGILYYYLRWCKPVMRILLLLYHGVENAKLLTLITDWTATATMTSSSEYTYPG
jgi:hypothetical protein